jgi:hypothetical protein
VDRGILVKLEVALGQQKSAQACVQRTSRRNSAGVYNPRLPFKTRFCESVATASRPVTPYPQPGHEAESQTQSSTERFLALASATASTEGRQRSQFVPTEFNDVLQWFYIT